MKGWLIGAAVALGGVGLAVLKADLEDSTVCQWLARKLIYQAAQRLPEKERARWREEWIRHDLDVPGRLLPLVRALDIFFRAGNWGRMLRGAPSRSQVLVARVRAAWLWLRSLPTARARARERARERQVRELSKQLHPTNRVRAQAEAAQATAVALDAHLVASGATRSGGSATLGHPRKVRVAFGGWRDGMMHLSDADFVAWLAEERQQFEDHLDRKVEAWLGRTDRFPFPQG
jgi:hypothetical protein